MESARALAKALAIVTAVGASPPAAVTAQELTEVFSAGAPGSDVVFGQVASVAFGAAGAVLVLDPMAAQVLVLDERGTVVAVHGGRGRGPGEFVNPLSLAASQEGETFAVWDAGTLRVSYFNRRGFETSWQLPAGIGVPSALVGFSGDRLIVHLTSLPMLGMEMSEGGMSLLSFDRNGRRAAVHRFPELVLDVAPGALPTIFNPTVVAAVLPGGGVIAGHSDAYTLSVFAPDGRVMGEVGRAITRREVPETLKETTRRSLRNPGDDEPEWLTGASRLPDAMRHRFSRNLRFAEYLPVITRVFPVDDNLLLVARGLGVGDDHAPPIGDGRAPPWMDVLDRRTGAYCGLLKLPDGFSAMAAKGSRLAGLQEHPQGIPIVRVLELSGHAVKGC